jgi:hypothetical protein
MVIFYSYVSLPEGMGIELEPLVFFGGPKKEGRLPSLRWRRCVGPAMTSTWCPPAKMAPLMSMTSWKRVVACLTLGQNICENNRRVPSLEASFVGTENRSISIQWPMIKVWKRFMTWSIWHWCLDKNVRAPNVSCSNVVPHAEEWSQKGTNFTSTLVL